MDRLTNVLANLLGPVLRPLSRKLLADTFPYRTWHIETGFVAVVLVGVALVTTPDPQMLVTYADIAPFLIIWLSVLAVLGSFLHAKVGYRMAEALKAHAAPPASCHEWSGTYWVAKELLWLVVFMLSGAYPAIAGTIIFIVYPAWRKIHVEERKKLRGEGVA